MKKFLLFLLLCTVIISSAIGFTACDLLENKSHSREYSNLQSGTRNNDDNMVYETAEEKTTSDEYFEFIYLEETDSYSIKAKDKNNIPEKIVLPAEHDGKKVTHIGYGFPNGESTWSSWGIGDDLESTNYAFIGCTDLKMVIIPEGVTCIGMGAFSYNDSLENVIISHTVNQIGSDAFRNCKVLKNIIIPDGVTKIESYTFLHCFFLESVTLPESLVEIGSEAFEDCYSLLSITLPSNLTKIGNYAFYGCYSLMEIYNKSSLVIEAGSSENEYIAEYTKAVYTSPYTSKLTNKNGYILYNGNILVGYNGKQTSLIIPNGITEIISGAFYERSNLTNVTIAKTVKKIGENAFRNCTSLIKINFDGTIEQWNNITKDSKWRKKSAIKQIVCTDGVIDL